MLVISGMHISCIGLFCYGLLRKKEILFVPVRQRLYFVLLCENDRDGNICYPGMDYVCTSYGSQAVRAKL